ncbi:MAG: porin [Sulfuritalea sp.]|nr:porin [Sulfuritalea sp.]
MAKPGWGQHTPAASGDKYSLGVTVPVLSKGAVSLGYAKSSVDVGNPDADAWALLFTYDLSKRTTSVHWLHCSEQRRCCWSRYRYCYYGE